MEANGEKRRQGEIGKTRQGEDGVAMDRVRQNLVQRLRGKEGKIGFLFGFFGQGVKKNQLEIGVFFG